MRAQVHSVSLFDSEGLIERVDLFQRSEHTVLGRRVRVREQTRAKCVLTDLSAPDLGPSHIEALRSGQSVDHRRFGAIERPNVGAVSYGDASQVSDVGGINAFLASYRDTYGGQGALAPLEAAEPSSGVASAR